MATTEEIIRRWFQVERGDKRGYLAPRSSAIQPVKGALYSYGRHFPLVETLRGKDGELVAWLLNGDRSTVSTTRHQSHVESASRGQGSRVTIPFSVLNEAMIDRSTIQIVESTTDRLEEWWVDHDEMPDSVEWQYLNSPVPGTGGYTVDGRFYPYSFTHWHGGPIKMTAQERADRERILNRRKTTWAHDKNGDYTATIVVDEGVVEHATLVKNTGRRVLAKKRGWGEVELGWDGLEQRVVYSVKHTRHWLGESLIRAQVQGYVNGASVKRWAYFLSGFDHNEARPSYFFAELPRGAKPTSVAEAYEALKPRAVVIAEQAGRKVERQGDIFAIPMPDLTLETLRSMGGVPHKRKVTTINVPRPSWASPITHKEPSEQSYVLRTNHTVTEVVTVGKQTFARGTMRHEPTGRRPDHARIRLGDGKTWHLVVKNTVPVTKARTPRRNAA